MTRSIVLLALAALLVGAALAAAGVVGPAASPRAKLVVDSGGALFGAGDAANLLPGERRSACVGVRNAGDAAGRAALYASGVRGALAPYLRLTVTAGTSCERFDDRSVLFRGRLSDFPAHVSEAILEPEQWAPGGGRAYRFALELGDDPRAAGRTAHWDWRMAVESVAAARAASRAASSRCDVVQLAGTVAGRTRTLVRTVQVNRRVRAVLMLRTFGSAGATRVVVTTGLRVGGASTLLLPDWADVRYRLNGARAEVAGERPFRARIAASKFAAGRTRVSVAVQPRRGRKRVTAFSLRVTPTAIGGRTVCVVSA